jgi:RIP homotypic interaction motif
MASLCVNGVGAMDPITLIVTALAAGAALGAQDTVSAMVKDAYAGLKVLVKRRLGGGSGAELVLARHEQAPDTWQAPLMAELAETGADGDHDLIAAAQVLLDLVGGAEGPTGKYTVDVRGAQGVQIGDHNRQDNVFNAPADGAGPL